MECSDFRIVPSHDYLAVNKNGDVLWPKDDALLRKYILDGYWYVDDPITNKSLRVHRLVAAAWVKNPNPEKFEIVNHLDGDRLNNWFENLEWTNYSGNNYHAVKSGLRSDAIECQVRDYYTKEVFDFPSVIQAAEFMKLGTRSIPFLLTRKFGKLLAKRYEFRLKTDVGHWFYENRPLTRPSRFLVTVEHEDGTTTEHFHYKDLLKTYQLYKSPFGRSVPALVDHASKLYPNKKFSVRDGFREHRQRVHRKTRLSYQTPVTARKKKKVLEFKSLITCARFFKCDRSKIQLRLDNNRDMDGWTFTTKHCPPESKGSCVTPLTAGTS